MTAYPPQQESIPLGEVGVHGTGEDLVIVTFGNGYYLSRQAHPRLEAAGLKTRIVDLRWLAPLPEESLLKAVAGCKRILVVDECRRSGGPSEALITLFNEKGGVPVSRIASEDSFIATGPAYAATMPSAESIYQAAMALK
jgi:2-oxoisovalerate dehydrogenase E1 component